MSKEEEKKLRLNPNSDLTILLDKVFKNVFNPSKNKKIRHVFEDDKSDVNRRDLRGVERQLESVRQTLLLRRCIRATRWE